MAIADKPDEPDRSTDEDLEFAPVSNGVDFLRNAITNLPSPDDPQSIKYAVLHLQAAIEILVKVRLQREGNQHIFEDPYSADETKTPQWRLP